ncbi:hypothetical protein [Pedobacter sp. WC2423]|uniref:hypothetical protein n=1 Tax=Pedobacter sp. WC2423 TaxID=3234142 RepID=UPI003465F070
MNNILKIAKIDAYSITPKYLQLINSILQGIQSGQIKKMIYFPPSMSLVMHWKLPEVR